MMHCRRWGVVLTVWLLSSWAVGASASQPTVSALQPTGFQRGGSAELILVGVRIGDARELLFYSPGITVRELESLADNRVRAVLDIDPECRLGIHALRLRTSWGVSNLRTFGIGALPEAVEEDPNSDFASPQPIALDTTVRGVVLNEDVDYFVVEAEAGERILVEAEGMRLGYTMFDPYVAIMDENRFQLARSDASALLLHDPVCGILAPEAGRYIIQMRESAYGGSNASHYRLHVGRFPRPTAVYPAGGRPGETLELRWLGDPGGEWTEQRTLPDQPDTAYGLFARTETGIAPSPNLIRVVDLENTLEREPNDSREQATPARVPGALNGVIQSPGDVDYFRFSATEGQVYDMRVHARTPHRSPLDSVLTVLRSNGAQVGSNDDSDGPDSYLRFTAPADDEYFVRVHDHLGRGGPDFVYRVEIDTVRPSLTLSLPERIRNQSTSLTVHRGNRMALMVNAARENWNGEVALQFEGLPAGISVWTAPLAQGQTSAPVLFTAAEDAPLGGELVSLIGRSTDESAAVEGRLRQRTVLVRGRNNIDVWGHDTDRLAAVVADRVPFSLEIVPSPAPLVRGGEKTIRVRAERDEGFDQPIAISLLYNPPGIGSSGAVTIPGDQSEAEIPLTANDNAGLGAWPLIVTGSAAYREGTVEVASPLAELTVAPAFFQFTFERAAGEQGSGTELVVTVANQVPFEGQATVRLVGLPANTSTDEEPQTLTQDTETLVFPISIGAEAAVGVHRSLVCQASVVIAGEPVLHTLPGGELRIDEPLPEPVAAAPVVTRPAETPPEPEAKTKRLSRLEQLRLRQMQPASEEP